MPDEPQLQGLSSRNMTVDILHHQVRGSHRGGKEASERIAHPLLNFPQSNGQALDNFMICCSYSILRECEGDLDKSFHI